mmetsp:Transcript_75704/g.202613  ORF Transcript_75704/g.202613 Transcript_75704/m.202613 type:complete len:85 (+) Transcript_75704:97-351(+)
MVLRYRPWTSPQLLSRKFLISGNIRDCSRGLRVTKNRTTVFGETRGLADNCLLFIGEGIVQTAMNGSFREPRERNAVDRDVSRQ